MIVLSCLIPATPCLLTPLPSWDSKVYLWPTRDWSQETKDEWKVENVSRSFMFNSVIPQTVARQAPLSRGFSRQEYWSGLPFPSPRDLPYPGIKPRSPALQADSLSYVTRGEGKMENLLWKTVWQSLRKIHVESPSNPVSPLVGAEKRRGMSTPHVHMNVHSSIFHKSQNVETTQTPFNWWTDKANVVYF